MIRDNYNGVSVRVVYIIGTVLTSSAVWWLWNYSEIAYFLPAARSHYIPWHEIVLAIFAISGLYSLTIGNMRETLMKHHLMDLIIEHLEDAKKRD